MRFQEGRDGWLGRHRGCIHPVQVRFWEGRDGWLGRGCIHPVQVRFWDGRDGWLGRHRGCIPPGTSEVPGG